MLNFVDAIHDVINMKNNGFFDDVCPGNDAVRKMVELVRESEILDKFSCIDANFLTLIKIIHGTILYCLQEGLKHISEKEVIEILGTEEIKYMVFTTIVNDRSEDKNILEKLFLDCLKIDLCSSSQTIELAQTIRNFLDRRNVI